VTVVTRSELMVVSVHGRAACDALAVSREQVDAAVAEIESALQGARQLRAAHPARFGNFNHHHDQLINNARWAFDLFSAAAHTATDPRQSFVYRQVIHSPLVKCFGERD
jgi:hypothetical protein